MTAALDALAATEGRIVVLSPHLDDAVLSLGASIAALTRRGAHVDVVTVLAGDPMLSAPAGAYDRSCGFTSADEAAGIRRSEDAVACCTIGARPIWLPFRTGEYCRYPGAATERTIVSAIESTLTDAGLVLIPGFPLLHFDHSWLSHLVLTQVNVDAPLTCYVEQPYAMSRYFGSRMRVKPPLRGVLDGLQTRWKGKLAIDNPIQLTGFDRNGVNWAVLGVSPRDHLAKHRAIGAYRTQLPKLGALLRTRLSIFESCWGGEALTTLTLKSES